MRGGVRLTSGAESLHVLADCAHVLMEALSMGKYRTRLQIVADMLSVVNVNDGARKTQIMYQANLSYKLLKRYLNEISASGLVRCGADDCYQLTPKGRDFLGRFGEYFERRQSVERRFNKILDERTTLETKFFNTKATTVSRSRKTSDEDED